MLVKELIARLQTMPQEYPVWLQVNELGIVADVAEDTSTPTGSVPSVFCDEKNAVYICGTTQE